MAKPFSVELYELTHRGNRGDLELYHRAVDGAEHTLELGCGAGRILLSLAEAGHRVTGLDIHEGALDVLRARLASLVTEARSRVKLSHGDMRSFDFADRFDRVLIPYNGLYCLLSDEEVLSCLTTARAHLVDGGRLVLDAYLVDDDAVTEFRQAPSVDASIHLGTIEDDGRTIEIFEETDWDPDRQYMDVLYRYEIAERGETRVETYNIEQRYLNPEQLEDLARRAGFEDVRVHIGFGSEAEDDRQMVLTAER